MSETQIHLLEPPAPHLLWNQAAAVPPSALPPVVKRVPAACFPEFKVALRLDDKRIRDLTGKNGGAIPSRFPYRQTCSVCGQEHDFDVRLSAAEFERLRRRFSASSEEPTPHEASPGPWSTGLERGRSSLEPIPSDPTRTIMKLSQTPIARANRLAGRGRQQHVDDAEAIPALEEAIELFASLLYYSGPIAQCRVELAERLADRDPERARELIKLAMPLMHDPVMSGHRERAVALAERLGLKVEIKARGPRIIS